MGKQKRFRESVRRDEMRLRDSVPKDWTRLRDSVVRQRAQGLGKAV